MARIRRPTGSDRGSELRSSLTYLAVVAALIFVPLAVPGVSLLDVGAFYLAVMIAVYLVICAIGLYRSLWHRGS